MLQKEAASNRRSFYQKGVGHEQKEKFNTHSYSSRGNTALNVEKQIIISCFQEPKPKIDISLVEHTSVMRGAIPVLPVSLAWFCLVCNVILPGTGTVYNSILNHNLNFNMNFRNRFQWYVLLMYW